jgi:hypothetical protein
MIPVEWEWARTTCWWADSILDRHTRRVRRVLLGFTSGSVGDRALMARLRERSLCGHSRDDERDWVVREEEVARLRRLGIHPDSLAGRLRLVLTIGCYGDFRFTRDILSTSMRPDRLELAIEALVDLGADCDCQVFRAVGQLPRGVLWHHPTAHGAQ